jgi:hypothetical protein
MKFKYTYVGELELGSHMSFDSNSKVLNNPCPLSSMATYGIPFYSLLGCCTGFFFFSYFFPQVILHSWHCFVFFFNVVKPVLLYAQCLNGFLLHAGYNQNY